MGHLFQALLQKRVKGAQMLLRAQRLEIIYQFNKHLQLAWPPLILKGSVWHHDRLGINPAVLPLQLSSLVGH